MLQMCAKKVKVVQVLLAEMVLAVNSTGTIEISHSSMKRVVLVLSIENSLIVTKAVIQQWLIMTYPLTGRAVAVAVAVMAAAVATAAVAATVVVCRVSGIGEGGGSRGVGIGGFGIGRCHIPCSGLL
jgi:hypothetical protein